MSVERLVHEVAERSARATLGNLSPASESLRRFLEARFNVPAGSEGSFLSTPVVEALFPWEAADRTMATLAGSLLSTELVQALDTAEGEQRFANTRLPYTHQLRAWQSLKEEPRRSVVVTSGTGSGKTECFLVPILDDFARESAGSMQLEGVRALFLYPLNALIASQKDRLTAWTKPFEGRLRFALYNGTMPEQPRRKAEQDAAGWEVLSRKALRASPPPLLITNSTMLEYMLVRNIDSPIMEKSRGMLRWIVIDEAHTYIGSQAAELSMLLRRVMQAFGVEAHNVRFVATSATIGSGEKTAGELGDFLADVAGLPRDRVVVVPGRRTVPSLPTATGGVEIDLDHFAGLSDPAKRYSALVNASTARGLRDALTQPTTVKQLSQLAGMGGDPQRVQQWLDLGCDAKSSDSETAFLPIRLHLFHRTLTGLWSCLNESCTGRAGTPLALGWPFGKVFFERRDNCEACQALVYEVRFCSRCGGEFLEAERHDDAGSELLSPTGISLSIEADDTGDDAEDADTGDEDKTLEATPTQCLLAGTQNGRVKRVDETRNPVETGIDPASGYTGAGQRICRVHDTTWCPRCGAYERKRGDLFRAVRSGAPFYLQVSTPTLLEMSPPMPGVNETPLPFDGRRTITFTDSRQGSATFALRMQRESERNYVRSWLFHRVSRPGVSDAEATDLAYFKKQALAAPTDGYARNKVAELESKATGGISWVDAVGELSQHPDFERFIKPHWVEHYGVTDARELSRILLYRELLRRPERMNTIETMGLAALSFPALQDALLPSSARRAGLNEQEWRDFLKLCVDFTFRARTAVQVDENTLWFTGSPTKKAYRILGPGALASDSAYEAPWPRPAGMHRLVRLVRAALALPEGTRETEQVVADLLESAFEELRAFTTPDGTGWKLDFKKARIVPIFAAWRCPMTRRLLDTTFRGFTPYLGATTELQTAGQKIEMPRLPAPFPTLAVDREKISAWLRDDLKVQTLRAAGLWTDLHDRLSRFVRALLVEEHSAQQPPGKLQRYSDDFKRGALNVLSCSTTMEMGVDIGGLTTIAMNNAPPGPANFLQRAGRAGRRGEGLAASLTMCKAVPHGEAVFRNPLWPFTTPLHVPRVSLDAAPVIERHVNAFLLTHFLKLDKSEKSKEKLVSSWFFGAEGKPLSRAAIFRDLLDKPDDGRDTALKQLVRQTCLEQSAPEAIRRRCADALLEIELDWSGERAALTAQLEGLEEDEPARRALEIQLKRLQEEYLLRDLTDRAFLPVHGFPTGIVPFIDTTIGDLKKRAEVSADDRDDNLGRRRTFPSRDLPMAIREYAPGNPVVLDQKVFTSAGVTLNWKMPATVEAVREVQAIQYAWSCGTCGQGGRSGQQVAQCPACDSKVRAWRYLKPAGFAVDFYEDPSIEVPIVPFIAPNPPVLALSGEWRSLANPGVGRFRLVDDALAIHASRGTHNLGFALCLVCGRAASETARAPHTTSSLPEALSRGGLGHKRLRSGKGKKGRECPTSSKLDGFSIQRGLALGTVETTCAFELQLERPDGTAPSGTALFSVGVALRQASAEYLGVEQQELGVALSTALRGDRSSSPTLALFDTAPGGAGFAVRLADRVKDLLARAADILDCKSGCDRACHSCLLSYDTQFEIDRLDRKSGRELLSDDLLRSLDLPKVLRVFGPDTALETSDVLTACRESLRRAGTDTLRVHLGGAVQDWDVGAWRLRHSLVRWALDGVNVELVLHKADRLALPAETAEALASLCELMPEKLCIVELSAGAVGSPASLLIESGGAHHSSKWATTESASACPDAEWAMRSGAQVLRMTGEEPLPPLQGERLEPGKLRSPSPLTMARVQVEKQVDHLPVGNFGTALVKAIATQSPGLLQRLDAGLPIKLITYSDRYVRSPLAARLLYELIRRLLSVPGAWTPLTSFRLSTLAPKGMERSQTAFGDDWGVHQLKPVLTAIFGEVGSKALIANVDVKADLKEIAHWRELSIEWSDGTRWKADFDQGMGFVRSPPGRFPFGLSATEQAGRVKEESFVVNVWPGGTRIHASALEAPK